MILINTLVKETGELRLEIGSGYGIAFNTTVGEIQDLCTRLKKILGE